MKKKKLEFCKSVVMLAIKVDDYQLCKVDEAIDTMNRRALFTDNIHPKMLSLGTAIRIVKEACE